MEKKIEDDNEEKVQQIKKAIDELIDMTTKNQNIPHQPSRSLPNKVQPLPPWHRTTATLVSSNTTSEFSDDEREDIQAVKAHDKQELGKSI